MKQVSPAIVIHNWQPDFNSLAGGLLAICGTLGVVAQLLLDFFAWFILIAIWVCLITLVWWLGYSRVTVTPEALTLVGCGLWRRPCYVSLLIELKLEGQWALAAPATYREVPTLDFYADWDWDTPADYLTIKDQGEVISQFFSLKQYAKIQAAVAQLATYPAASLTSSLAPAPDA